MTKLVILDRDGVINQDSMEYIKSPEEWVALPQSIEAIAALKQKGYLVAIVTNQSGIARGHYDEATLQAIHEKMLNQLEALGATLDSIEYCRHMPDSGCSRRKPQPGMLTHTLHKLGCEPEDSVMIGDRVTDLLAARAANIECRMILSPMTDRKALHALGKVPLYTSLNACVQDLLTAVDTPLTSV